MKIHQVLTAPGALAPDRAPLRLTRTLSAAASTVLAPLARIYRALGRLCAAQAGRDANAAGPGSTLARRDGARRLMMLTLWTCQFASAFTLGWRFAGTAGIEPAHAALETAVLPFELRPYAAVGT
jgi:hypothetical protein